MSNEELEDVLDHYLSLCVIYMSSDILNGEKPLQQFFMYVGRVRNGLENGKSVDDIICHFLGLFLGLKEEPVFNCDIGQNSQIDEIVEWFRRRFNYDKRLDNYRMNLCLLSCISDIIMENIIKDTPSY